MQLLLASLIVLTVSGLLTALRGRSSTFSSALGVGGAVTGSAIGLATSVSFVVSGASKSLLLPWSMPGGAFHIQIDPLSAWFLVPVFGLGLLGAVYGAGYLKNHPAGGGTWFFYNILVASMALVIIARNGVLFLLAWEVMSLASFFLVAFEHEKPAVRKAAWLYMIATHLGTAFLLVMFVLLGARAGSLDFDAFAQVGPTLPAAPATLVFLFALIGFGVKAGFIPLHVWLPEAHPAAPSHVSALMSGVMIKTGIYGLARTLTFLGAPPSWWGWCLLGIGLGSGILGVLFALAQHDLKRLLAYSSVENIGIIALGLGLGLLGISYGSQTLAALGFAGALLHVLNHTLFKGLMFLGAGSVLHGTGTLDIDHLGGLLKKMPWTGLTFLVGAAAICGLPPLNGFVSEFLLYVAAFDGARSGSVATVIACVAAITGLALIGGLAVACFTKAFGIVFLGEPRSAHAAHAHEAGPSMRLPMALLALACILVGLSGPLALHAVTPAAAVLAKTSPMAEPVALAGPALAWVSGTFAGLIVLIGALTVLRKRVLKGRSVEQTVTWDCGYARPTARMQYTASSFAQPLTNLFAAALGTRRRVRLPQTILPTDATFSSETPDLFQDRLFRPAFERVASALAHLRRFQQGRVQLYVLYLALTLFVLLLFNLK